MATAQEGVAPLLHNAALQGRAAAPALPMKTTALTLPFFEDFTDYSPYPNATRWADSNAYINNTMGVDVVSRGVATFDALNDRGLPYNPTNANVVGYADTMRSQPIDLSALAPGDSLYFSFFYQPQGNGFSPEPQDSLILYFRKNASTWQLVWVKEGTTLQPFTQVMLPLTDTAYFKADFQFRFINKASINTNDDVWNVDYIRLAANRNINDTAVNDVAYAAPAGFMLDDYTYMPYRQFLADANGERAANMGITIRNNYTNAQNVTYGYTAREAVSNTPLANSGGNTASINGRTTAQFSLPVYTNTVPAPGTNDRVVFENKFYLQPINAADPRVNDTIIHEQVFDNYLAYDDGTAEKSYYLNLFATLPGRLVIEHHLNQPDTLRGLAIYFGRQVPTGAFKDFAITVYQDIAFGGGTDQLLYEQDFYLPGYLDVNNYYVYTFDQPVVLPAGTFYVGTRQPAGGISDSLYFGLDVNRTTGNHAYYNVLNFWESSIISGAVMMRPILGQKVSGSKVETVTAAAPTWQMAPNPAANTLQFYTSRRTGKPCNFEIYDMQGRVVKQGQTMGDETINIAELIPGIYMVRLTIDGQAGAPQKLIKL